MRTDTLISLLARSAGPAPRQLVVRRIGIAAALGLFVSVSLVFFIMGALPASVFYTPAPWVKLAYGAGLLAPALILAGRLARPGMRQGGWGYLPWVVVCAMWMAGAANITLAPSGLRAPVLFGQTWLACPWMVLAFSLPSMVAMFWALKGLAPTHLRFAGFAAGLAAGASGALAYSLACPEASTTFVAVWYTLGIGLSTLLGGALGPRLLRW